MEFFAAVSRRFVEFAGGFARFRGGFARLRTLTHTAQWCLRKDSQPFRKARSQLRKRVPVVVSSWNVEIDWTAARVCAKGC